MPATIDKLELFSLLPVDKPTRRDRTIGHEFKVSIALTDIRNCILEWWEKTDQPYVDGMQPGVWCDLFKLHPRSDVFDRWNFHVNTVPLGLVELQLKDPPGIMVSESEGRELCFEIRVKENNPYGDNRQRRIKAKQLLKTRPGLAHQFIVMENDCHSDVSSLPPIW